MRVIAWRDYDDSVVRGSPEMDLGTIALRGRVVEAAGRLAESGARLVRIPEPVDLRSEAAVHRLVLVRELNRHSIPVVWSLVLDATAHDWRELAHLSPPESLLVSHGPGAPSEEDAAGLRRWREGFHFCRFIVRRGPGFVQFRDRRWTRPRVTTVGAGDVLTFVESLLEAPVPVHDAPDVWTELERLRLVHPVSELLWLPAYRVRRWPVPAEFV